MTDDSSTANLHRLAIDAALKSEWNKALEINQQIQSLEPQNTECLNRLAKAYFELGDLVKSKRLYQDVLELDPYNSIAAKNIKKISSCKDNHNQKTLNGISPILSPAFFVSEPGITKSVSLIKVAEPQRLLSLSAGMMVNLVVKARGISVADINKNYLGVLPDDISFHLMRLINGGNKYQAFIQSVKPNALVILIREIYRSKKFKNQASFLGESKVLAYSLNHISLLNDEEDSSEAITNEAEDITI
jgi:tetratricopeptide (TPR) repeat protein